MSGQITSISSYPLIPFIDRVWNYIKSEKANSVAVAVLNPNKITLPVQDPHYHPNDLTLSESKPASYKLSRELARAEKHRKAQKSRSWFSRSFESLSRRPCGYRVDSHEEMVISGKAGIAHAQGMRETMEDFHIAVSGTYPLNYELFGVIDGHGGSATAAFVAEHIQEEIEKAIKKHGTTDSEIRKALKEAFVQLDARIAREILDFSGAASVISLKIGSAIWTANLGDSRAVLKAGDKILQLSEDAKPDSPRFKKAIKKRGGWIETIFGVPRINGVLACARAFGDKGLRGAEGHYVVSPRPKITKVDLKPYSGEPIHLIQACDGIWDVASSQEVAAIVGIQNNTEDAAAAIVRGALNAGSTDNCSALVVHLS